MVLVNIVVSGQHVIDFPEIEVYSKNKIRKLEKFHPKIEKIEIRLISKTSHRNKNTDYFCELYIDIPGKNLEIKEVANSMDKAIDLAVERMKNVLVNDKGKRLDEKHRATIRGK